MHTHQHVIEADLRLVDLLKFENLG
jgi:hypothetical protein